MDKFGWSYPAGCSGPPDDDYDPYCKICGRHEEECICPECSVCGAKGDPECYSEKTHGLVQSDEQIASFKSMEDLWKRLAEQEE